VARDLWRRRRANIFHEGGKAKLGFTYPYHQSIGFYLNRAGYSEQDQLLAKTKGLQFDFYLCHGLKDPVLDQDWKIFFPQTLG